MGRYLERTDLLPLWNKIKEMMAEQPSGEGGDHECLVKSVNGQTGDVVIDIPENDSAVKSVNGQTGDVTLTAKDVGALSSSGTAVNADKLGGQGPEYYLRKVNNLLDNSDFRNPVNQRGKVRYSGSGYCIDRWKSQTYYSFISISANQYLTLYIGNSGTEASMFQRIHIDKIKSGTKYTVAFKTYAGSVYSTTFTARVSMSEVTAGSPFNKVQFGYDGHYYVRLVTTNSTGVSIEWVALYEGSFTADELPAYIPKGYATELLECQRYYRRDVTANRVICGYYTGSAKQFVFPFPYEMRETPRVVASGTGVFRTVSGYSKASGYTTSAGGSLTDLTIEVLSYGVSFNFSVAAATNNTPGTLTLNDDAYIEYIADL